MRKLQDIINEATIDFSPALLYEAYALGIKNNNTKELFRSDYEKIINYFGEENQMEKLKEECLELAKAINNGKIERIRSEVADVLNMINQFKIMQDENGNFINRLMMRKNKRTLERIKSKHYEKENSNDEDEVEASYNYGTDF